MDKKKWNILLGHDSLFLENGKNSLKYQSVLILWHQNTNVTEQLFYLNRLNLTLLENKKMLQLFPMHFFNWYSLPPLTIQILTYNLVVFSCKSKHRVVSNEKSSYWLQQKKKKKNVQYLTCFLKSY